MPARRQSDLALKPARRILNCPSLPYVSDAFRCIDGRSWRDVTLICAFLPSGIGYDRRGRCKTLRPFPGRHRFAATSLPGVQHVPKGANPREFRHSSLTKRHSGRLAESFVLYRRRETGTVSRFPGGSAWRRRRFAVAWGFDLELGYGSENGEPSRFPGDRLHFPFTPANLGRSVALSGRNGRYEASRAGKWLSVPVYDSTSGGGNRDGRPGAFSCTYDGKPGRSAVFRVGALGDCEGLRLRGALIWGWGFDRKTENRPVFPTG